MSMGEAVTSRLDEISRKLNARETLSFDDVADLFVNTSSGQYAMSHGISREDFLEKLHARFPDEKELNAWVMAASDLFDAFIERGKMQ